MEQKRYFGLDLVRVFACLMIIMVHSFSNGYNAAPMNGIVMFLFLMIRNVAFVGVLLFIILTGYFKCKKNICKEYYKSIKKLIKIYLIISIFTIFFRKYFMHDTMDMYGYILGIFNFTTIPYGWYFEMYIGLFVLIPFLNILYNNIESKKQKQLLIISLIIICSIPQTFETLFISNRSLNIFPSWWGKLYPILLYYIGCYIREYRLNINKYINLLMIVIWVFFESFVMYFYCEGNSLNDRVIIDYNFFPAVILSVLIFIYLYNIEIKGYRLKSIFKCISNVTFGMYLISFIVDKFLYSILIFNFSNNIKYFLGVVFYTPAVFLISFVLSLIIDVIINLFTKIMINFKHKHEIKYSGD